MQTYVLNHMPDRNDTTQLIIIKSVNKIINPSGKKYLNKTIVANSALERYLRCLLNVAVTCGKGDTLSS